MIGHVHLKVRVLERSLGFYEGVLGFRITERTGRYAFLTKGNKHHEIALNEVGANAQLPQEPSVGLYHFAIEAGNMEELKDYHRRLKKANIMVESVDHGISKALYLADPDGNGIEIYVDTRAENNCYQWQGKTTALNLEDQSH